MPGLIQPECKITFHPNGTADVTMTSLFSNKPHTLTLPITLESYTRWLNSGEYIQTALPNLSPSQREFLLSGMTDEEWDEMCKEVGEEE